MQSKKFYMIVIAVFVALLTTGCGTPPLHPYVPKTPFMVRINASQSISLIGNYTDDDISIDGTTYSISPWLHTDIDVLTRTGKITFERGSQKEEVWVKKGDGVFLLVGELSFGAVRTVTTTSELQASQNKK